MKSTPSSTTNVSEPNKWQLPYVNDIFSRGQAAANSLPTSYSGPVAALPQQGQYDAYNSMLGKTGAIGAAGGQQQQIGQKWASDILGGGTKMPTMAGYDFAGLDRSLDAEARPIMEKYTQQLIPQFQSDAMAAGAGTNSRALEQMPQVFNRDMSRELSDSFARMAMTDLDSQRQAQPQYAQMEQSLAAMLPQMAQGGLMGDAMTQQILASIQGLDQQGITADLQRLGLNQDLAFGPLERYANLIYGSGGGSTTQTTTQGSNPLQGALGGIMGGAGIGSALALSNPWTAGIAGVMGLLGGLGG